jgi:hypothetical protein
MRCVRSTAQVIDASYVEATAQFIAALARRLGEVYEPGMFLA